MELNPNFIYMYQLVPFLWDFPVKTAYTYLVSPHPPKMLAPTHPDNGGGSRALYFVVFSCSKLNTATSPTCSVP
jgi:hypothetical protein